MLSTKWQNSLEIVSLFLVSLILFTYGLSSQEIIGFESRFYLFALEMWRYGFSWFPTTYHEPYPDYPVTSTLLIYLFAKLFGGLNKFVAVLPSAIAAAITVTVTYLIGALQTKRWGLHAVLFLFLTVAFFKNARSIALDMYPAMIATWCFYLIYSADKKNNPSRVKWIYPLLLLGFAFRGPIGLVMPTGVICIYYLLNWNIKRFFISGFIALFLLIISMVLLLALAYYVGGETFMQNVLHMEVLGRMNNTYLPIYFYFVDSLKNYALSYPIACLVVLGVGYYAIKKMTPPQTNFLLILVGWMVIILIGMSMPGDKKVRYILAIAPAAALIAAYPFSVEVRERYVARLHAFLIRCFLYLPAIFLLLIEAIYVYTNANNITIPISYVAISLFLIALQLISLAVIFRYINQPKWHETFILFAAAMSFVMTYIAVIEPMELYIERGRSFVVAIEGERMKSEARLAFYKVRPDALPIKYLINMPYALPKYEQPVFIGDPQGLMDFSSPTFFVTYQTEFVKLPPEMIEKFEVVGNDMLGHTRVVIFRRK